MASIREKLTANIDAIEIAFKLGKGTATPEQRQILQRYAGFGDLKCILLDPQKPHEFSQSERPLIPLVQRLHDVIAGNAPKQFNDYMYSLKNSVLTSFYTPGEVVNAINNAFIENRLAFGSVLDPSAGNGAFTAVKGERYTLVEKDLITSKILAALHPDKKVIPGPFENVPARLNNAFNLVTSNIPFGDLKVFDAGYINSNNVNLVRSANAIHTYFFEKGLDMLRNGGMLAFITSTGVMDSERHSDVRRHLLSRALLVSAVRLPENTFSDTKAQSDLIILQKDNRRDYDTPLTPIEQLFLTTQKVSDQIAINGLYASEDNNRTIATSRRTDTDMYGKPDIRFVHDGGVKGIAADLEKAVIRDIRNYYNRKLFLAHNQTAPTASGKPVQLNLFDDMTDYPVVQPKEPEFFEFDNVIYNVEGSFQLKGDDIGISKGDGTADFYKEKDENVRQLIRDYVRLRDAYFELKDFENANLRESPGLRAELNRTYDVFINTPYSRHILNRPLTIIDASKKLLNEPSYVELKSLEIVRDGKISKSDIFFEPVAFGREKEVYTPQEALHLCRNRLHVVDMDYLKMLTGLKENEIIEALQGQIYKHPGTFRYETADVFLSGNVVEKYELAAKAFAANAGDYDLKASMDALLQVIPAKIPFYDIDINLGERWLPTDYFSDFASHLFQTKASVFYSPAIDSFEVDADFSYYARQKYAVHSTNRYYNYTDVLRFALMDTMPEMTKTVGFGSEKKTVPDREGIEKMNAAILIIQAEWKKWRDNLPLDKKNELESLYNNRFNCFVRPNFDGSFQTFPGLDFSGVKFNELYQSQKDAILRIKCRNGGIIDHEVGGGKSAIMCISAYEMKRLNICHKPLIVGMKANTQEIAKTFRLLYPEANLLYADEQSFSPEKRAEFFNRIQNNNWDCIIMTHEQFKKIPQSDDVQRQVLTEELNKIDESLFALDDDEGWRFKRAKKDLEKRKNNLIVQIRSLNHAIAMQKDKVVDFKTMGIDHIFCDESHKFKNLRVTTKHTRVAGIGNTEGSQRSMDMKLAIRTIQDRNNSDLGVTFLSGTTIVNSCTELYVLFDYLRPRALEKQGISSFDAWASIYTKKSKEIEFGVTNELHLKERFREFVKVPELALFYSEITDFKTAKEIGLDRPVKNEILVSLEQTDEQKDMFERLKAFAKTGDGKLIERPKLSSNEIQAKMLIATNTAKKASIDMRLINEEKYNADASNRTQAVADNTFDYYHKYHANRGTQFIFCDIGTDKGDDRFSIYNDIRQKLVEKGIPEHEIRFIQDFKTDKRREKLFEDTNAGKVRVLLGSTEMLGTGVNAQERCVAIHHVDIPWTPKDFEQRNGRGIRKGNRVAKLFAGNKVDVFIYATKETLDTYKFNLVANKAHFIAQIKNGAINVRTLDEGGMDEHSGMSYSEYIAVLSGNTDLLEKAKLERQIVQYKAEERVFLQSSLDRDKKIKKCDDELTKNSFCLDCFNKDLAVYKSFQRNDKGLPVVEMKIGDKSFTDLKKFGEAINGILDKANRDTMTYQEIGSFGNFKLVMIAEKMVSENNQETFNNKLFVQGSLKYQYNKGQVPRTAEYAGKYPINVLDRIEKDLIPQYENQRKDLIDKKTNFEKVEYSFPNREKLEAAQTRLAEIKTKLEKMFGSANNGDIEWSYDRSKANGSRVKM